MFPGNRIKRAVVVAVPAMFRGNPVELRRDGGSRASGHAAAGIRSGLSR